jgi:hypothetical protein
MLFQIMTHSDRFGPSLSTPFIAPSSTLHIVLDSTEFLPKHVRACVAVEPCTACSVHHLHALFNSNPSPPPLLCASFPYSLFSSSLKKKKKESLAYFSPEKRPS